MCLNWYIIFASLFRIEYYFQLTAFLLSIKCFPLNNMQCLHYFTMLSFSNKSMKPPRVENSDGKLQKVDIQAKYRFIPFGIKSGVIGNLLHTKFKTTKYIGYNYYKIFCFVYMLIHKYDHIVFSWTAVKKIEGDSKQMQEYQINEFSLNSKNMKSNRKIIVLTLSIPISAVKK